MQLDEVFTGRSGTVQLSMEEAVETLQSAPSIRPGGEFAGQVASTLTSSPDPVVAALAAQLRAKDRIIEMVRLAAQRAVDGFREREARLKEREERVALAADTLRKRRTEVEKREKDVDVRLGRIDPELRKKEMRLREIDERLKRAEEVLTRADAVLMRERAVAAREAEVEKLRESIAGDRMDSETTYREKEAGLRVREEIVVKEEKRLQMVRLEFEGKVKRSMDLEDLTKKRSEALRITMKASREEIARDAWAIESQKDEIETTLRKASTIKQNVEMERFQIGRWADEVRREHDRLSGREKELRRREEEVERQSRALKEREELVAKTTERIGRLEAEAASLFR
ncbi:MAG TPA: hypothetical protein VI893_07000 [Thermoplasmata archaeon]|nr:hypothetical protein [Thermoplasmata archaeon]